MHPSQNAKTQSRRPILNAISSKQDINFQQSSNSFLSTPSTRVISNLHEEENTFSRGSDTISSLILCRQKRAISMTKPIALTLPELEAISREIRASKGSQIFSKTAREKL